ncbi:PF20097 family protein [Candidatus Stoquefichus massiliensis]|uniref:PF20097 family protein n=1 Tax=Candidatus Stoquefichus massiliensis TaxID=1470350 RepID=UPI00048028DC|nr:PF20097 family protein [Candidatus Stoquefichus massiliensis]
MICPYCHQEMIIGYIQSEKDLSWTPEEQPANLFVNRFKTYQVPLDKRHFFKMAIVKVYRCQKCQIEMIIEKDLKL